MQVEERQNRRNTGRFRKTFMPACLSIEDRQSVGLLRDLSVDGAGIQTEASLRIGQHIGYRWGDEEFRTGKVIWIDGLRVGLLNLDRPNVIEMDPARYRSVRIATHAPVTVHCEGHRIEGELLNIAQRGFCVLAAGKVRQGALATVQIGKRHFEQVTSKWLESDRIGFSLPTSLPIDCMAKVVEGR